MKSTRIQQNIDYVLIREGQFSQKSKDLIGKSMNIRIGNNLVSDIMKSAQNNNNPVIASLSAYAYIIKKLTGKAKKPDFIPEWDPEKNIPIPIENINPDNLRLEYVSRLLPYIENTYIDTNKISQCINIALAQEKQFVRNAYKGALDLELTIAGFKISEKLQNVKGDKKAIKKTISEIMDALRNSFGKEIYITDPNEVKKKPTSELNPNSPIESLEIEYRNKLKKELAKEAENIDQHLLDAQHLTIDKVKTTLDIDKLIIRPIERIEEKFDHDLPIFIANQGKVSDIIKLGIIEKKEDITKILSRASIDIKTQISLVNNGQKMTEEEVDSLITELKNKLKHTDYKKELKYIEQKLILLHDMRKDLDKFLKFAQDGSIIPNWLKIMPQEKIFEKYERVWFQDFGDTLVFPELTSNKIPISISYNMVDIPYEIQNGLTNDKLVLKFQLYLSLIDNKITKLKNMQITEIDHNPGKIMALTTEKVKGEVVVDPDLKNKKLNEILAAMPILEIKKIPITLKKIKKVEKEFENITHTPLVPSATGLVSNEIELAILKDKGLDETVKDIEIQIQQEIQKPTQISTSEKFELVDKQNKELQGKDIVSIVKEVDHKIIKLKELNKYLIKSKKSTRIKNKWTIWQKKINALDIPGNILRQFEEPWEKIFNGNLIFNINNKPKMLSTVFTEILKNKQDSPYLSDSFDNIILIVQDKIHKLENLSKQPEDPNPIATLNEAKEEVNKFENASDKLKNKIKDIIQNSTMIIVDVLPILRSKDNNPDRIHIMKFLRNINNTIDTIENMKLNDIIITEILNNAKKLKKYMENYNINYNKDIQNSIKTIQENIRKLKNEYEV